MVGLIIALICLLPFTACSKPAPRARIEQQAKTGASPNSPQNDRTAIPEIKGCTRDQTSFYRGKVARFRRTSKAIAITIRTDWDTTEELAQSTKTNPVEYRLQNHPISASEFKQIESRLKDHSAAVRATVWVCQVNTSQTVKIIDWEPTHSKLSR